MAVFLGKKKKIYLTTSMYAAKNKILLVIFMLLTGASAIYLMRSSSERFIPGPAFEFSELPDSIILFQKDDTVKLFKSSSGWQVNNKPADAGRINLLLATLQQSVARRRAARSQADSINQVLDLAGVQVETYATKKQLLSFRVTGNERTMKTFIRKGDELPVEVTIPGYRVYVAAIFHLPSIEWLDRRLFNFNWRNFKSLTAEFPGSASDNFEVSFNGRFFSVKDMPTDTSRLNTYLDEISLLEADAFLPAYELPDSLVRTVPLSRIQVHTVSGDTFTLSVYQSGTRLVGLSNHLPLSVFSGSKAQVLTRRRSWFKENQQ